MEGDCCSVLAVLISLNTTVIFLDEHDYIIIKKLSEQIEEQRQKQKIDDKLLKRYRLRDSYTCYNKQVTLNKGDVVEVLDTEKQSTWLVRMAVDREKVLRLQAFAIKIKLMTIQITVRISTHRSVHWKHALIDVSDIHTVL